MRSSQLFSKTLRQVSTEADTVSHQLLLKAGMIYQVASGVYSYLPLGLRVVRNIERIIREELDAQGAQEMMMPVLQPFELWERTGRHVSFGQGLFTLSDRRDRKLCLGPTHEEVITEIVHHNVNSYRDLPLLLYQIQTKFRDEARPRGGLLRVREFTMVDAYSFDAGEAELDLSYQKMIQAYKNIYSRCGLPTMVVEADSGAIGGKESHEFMLLTSSGEDKIIHCPNCDYAANVDKAQSIKPPGEQEEPLPMEEVATPGIRTIEELASFLHIPKSRTLKAVFYSADKDLVFVVTRGDLEVNEVKLRHVLYCSELNLASEEQVKRAHLVAGSASPLGLHGIRTVADESITLGTNFVAGANKPDFHIRNVNYPRDFQVDLLVDITLAQAGQGCPKCGAKLLSAPGIEVGHIFKLGTMFSQKLAAFFLTREGSRKPIVMGCYGIGIGRILAAAVEYYHDDKGIIWPKSLAPYHVYLCALGMDNPELAQVAEKLYAELEAVGMATLFDDRLDPPGVKFNDADLLGIPLRLILSQRCLKSESVEIKWRTEKEPQLVPIAEAASKIDELLSTRGDSN